ncbi:hypothetical protein FRB91_002803 [Serendipita sp. 411]|nr:hypothetical protein FRC19_002827 [Serendipita sp. 401]KAG8822946.1 hypothetical protein FRC18_010863 [Serendipita sp. 400]KAG8844153.1 hypothetical protein FRB91_002803 [Serendipita sp. 411]KAG8845303.1 hypothetical protein FRC20_003260 [Serendipita sp. 405]KAG9052048.1 hypothetical protein FS842_010585 [Serendipita sp. 407]
MSEPQRSKCFCGREIDGIRCICHDDQLSLLNPSWTHQDVVAFTPGSLSVLPPPLSWVEPAPASSCQRHSNITPSIGCQCSGTGTCLSCTTNAQSQSTVSVPNLPLQTQSPVTPTGGVPPSSATHPHLSAQNANVVQPVPSNGVNGSATTRRSQRILAQARQMVRGVATTVQRVLQRPTPPPNERRRGGGGLINKVFRRSRR